MTMTARVAWKLAADFLKLPSVVQGRISRKLELTDADDMTLLNNEFAELVFKNAKAADKLRELYAAVYKESRK